MKKLALIISIAGTVGLSSCAKDAKDIVCTQEGEYTHTLTNEKIVYCDDNDNCDSFTYEEFSNQTTAEINDQESVKDYLEKNGFTCN